MAASETSSPHDRMPQRHRIAENAAVVETCLTVKPPWNTVRTGSQGNVRPQRHRIAENAAGVEDTSHGNPSERYFQSHPRPSSFATPAPNRGKRCRCGIPPDRKTALEHREDGVTGKRTTTPAPNRRKRCRCGNLPDR